MNRQLAGLARTILAPRPALKSAARNSSHYKPPPSWFEPHMNELPIPQGSWKTAYEAQQRKNNMHLIVGVSFFIVTLISMKASGLIVLNYHVPKVPDN